MMARFPDFFVIGAPKCGTTSVFSWLQQHPDTFLPVKEPNFLSRDIMDSAGEAGAAQDEAEWLERLSPAQAEGKSTGESTPKYLYSDRALARLSQEASHIRLIVMLRNPVDLAIAMHAQNCRQGREKETVFRRAWARGPAKSGDLMTDYRFWGSPGRRLQRYMEAFPADRIRTFILEEEMRHDPQAAHAAILDFLGLQPHVLDDYSVKNERKSYASARLQGVSRQARRSAYAAMQRMGLSAPKGTGLLKVFDRFNQKDGAKSVIGEDVRQQVAAELHEDAMLTARLLGRTELPWPDFDWTQVQHSHKATGQHNSDEGQPT